MTHRPLASNRDRMLPTRPRRTASGLNRTRVRWGMARSLPGSRQARPAVPAGGLDKLDQPNHKLDQPNPDSSAEGSPLGLLDVDAATEEIRTGPQGCENHSEQKHHRDDYPQTDGRHLNSPPQKVGPRPAQQATVTRHTTLSPRPIDSAVPTATSATLIRTGVVRPRTTACSVSMAAQRALTSSLRSHEV